MRCTGGLSIIKATEPERHDLYIYSSPRKPRLERSGNLTGHWPNPHGEEERGWGGQGRLRRQAGGGDTGSWTPTGALITHPCARAHTGTRENRNASAALFAHRPRLMSLKGQTPLRKINGVSRAWGNGLWGPAGDISNMTVITTAEQRRKERSQTKMRTTQSPLGSRWWEENNMSAWFTCVNHSSVCVWWCVYNSEPKRDFNGLRKLKWGII